MIGVDYKGIDDVVFGGGLSYAYNRVHYSRDLGHSSINQESAVLYATLNTDYFYISTALWGGVFQSTNERRSLSFISSKSRPIGWNLSPHLELGSPVCVCQWFVINPFVAVDWAHNWQNHLRERGSSGFNIVLNKQYASVFRTELGLRFYETFQYGWGDLILEEKISYINRTPLQNGRHSASFIGAFSSFDVKTINSVSKNQGLVQIHVECIPSDLENFYSSLDYQEGFSSAFQSNILTFSVGKNF